jgi:predicted nucleic acid-binding protein
MILDSNIIIYSAEPQFQPIRDLITRHAPSVSAISYVEVLGFTQITATQQLEFQQFFARATVHPIDRPVLDGAVALRQQRRMSLGDAIIAATALVHGLTLVTRNTPDFRWISGLRLLDPIASPPTP